jgi:glycogen operon protein
LLTAGDEMGRTQRGNNNAYCQDNPVSWLEWKLSESDREMLEFARELFRIVRENPILRRRHFFAGKALDASKIKDVTWLGFDGHEMQPEDWGNARARSLGMLLHGSIPDRVDETGQNTTGSMLLLVVNASNRSKLFLLPRFRFKGSWKELLNTAQPSRRSVRDEGLAVAPHTLLLLSYERNNP